MSCDRLFPSASANNAGRPAQSFLRSQHAILKLGAKFEGELRKDKMRKDGTMRNSMIYSIIANEWPEIKKRLHARIYGQGGKN